MERNDAGILHGYAAIGAYLGITSDAARNRVAREGIPVVHSGRRVWIRRASLDIWLTEQEAKAKGGSHGAP